MGIRWWCADRKHAVRHGDRRGITSTCTTAAVVGGGSACQLGGVRGGMGTVDACGGGAVVGAHAYNMQGWSGGRVDDPEQPTAHSMHSGARAEGQLLGYGAMRQGVGGGPRTVNGAAHRGGVCAARVEAMRLGTGTLWRFCYKQWHTRKAYPV